jgi:hypothetical protein
MFESGSKMPNGYFNNQVRQGLKGGKGASTAKTGSLPKPSLNLKPGFNTSAPGKKQKDRSAGVKRAKIYPSSDGL